MSRVVQMRYRDAIGCAYAIRWARYRIAIGWARYRIGMLSDRYRMCARYRNMIAYSGYQNVIGNKIELCYRMLIGLPIFFVVGMGTGTVPAEHMPSMKS